MATELLASSGARHPEFDFAVTKGYQRQNRLSDENLRFSIKVAAAKRVSLFDSTTGGISLLLALSQFVAFSSYVGKPRKSQKRT